MATLPDLFVRVAGTDPLIQALVGGVVIAALNLVGASLIFLVSDPSERLLDAALGFGAGVMISASFTSLILPGVEYAGGGFGGLLPVVVGIGLGVLVLDQADRWLPHLHVLASGHTREEAGNPDPTADDTRFSAIMLFIIAITLHNVPEGLAVGVGFGADEELGNALALMLAIGFQNIPEGLAVSAAAVNAGFERSWYAMLTGLRSGLVEIPAALIGAYAVIAVAPLLPYAMGFAAGAMLFVVSDEILPETHARGNERAATMGTMVGLVAMLTLDVALASIPV